MGCDTYSVQASQKEGWGELYIHFTEREDDVVCLCTFPHNNKFTKTITGEEVLSLAMLGATMVMAHHGDYKGKEWVYIPSCLPSWIIESLKRHIIT